MSPDDSAVFGAALLSQCFLPVLRGSRRNGENHRQVATIGLETRKRRTDRRYDIFFITPFVPNLRRPRTNTNFIYIYIYSASGLFASCIGAEKNKRPLSLSSFAFFLALSSKFSWKKRGNDATNSFYHVRNSLTYEFLDLL